MKTLRLLGLLLIAGVLISCEKDIEKNNVTQDVVFGIEHVAPLKSIPDNGGNGDFQPTPPEEWYCVDNFMDIEDLTARIRIDGFVDPFTPDVFIIDGKLYTQSIKLASRPTPYVVTEFVLLDGDGEIIMATPEIGSEYADYVGNPVSFEFYVNDFEKAQVNVDVLCFIPAEYNAFGFTWFNIGRIIIHEAWFFGDVCIDEVELFEGSLYDTHFGPFVDGFYDVQAIFQVVVKNNGVQVGETFTNENWTEFDKPLSVKYPEYLDMDNSNITFELWVLHPTDGFVYITTFDLDDLVEGEVVNFVMGGCVYNPDGEIIELGWPPLE